MAKTKLTARLRRKASIRKRLQGTPERPRLTVFRSNRHIYAQVIDDENNKVLAQAGTTSKVERDGLDGKKKVEVATVVGTRVGKKCKGQGIEQVIFDRNGFRYHGRVKALAEAARKAGLVF